MIDDRRDIPTPGAPNFDERVKETLSIALGYRGDGLDRMLTVRDLSAANLITLKPGYLKAGRMSPVAGAGSALQASYQADLTPPPTPTGLIASAAISNLIVGTDRPILGMGHGYAKTILYGASYTSGALPTFSNAVKLTEFTGQVHAYPTNPSTEWHLWVTWVTVDGVESASPAGGTNGVTVTTGQNVSTLLTALAGQITATQLYSALGARINLIDAPSTGLVTLVANNSTAISSEVTNRTNADSALAGQITTVQARLNTGDFAAVQVQSQASASAVTGLYAQYTVKTDVAGLVSGYGLASTSSGATPTSSFGVRATSFFVAPASVAQSTAPTTGLYPGFVWLDTSVMPNVTRYWDGSAFSLAPQALPFTVQTAPATINGVSVPAGVYITDAYIRNGTITNAKIGNAAIDTAKIADASIATAKIADAAITTAKIGTAQITTALIGTAAITTALIADASITNAKIIDLSADKITAGYLDAARIQVNTITASKIISREIARPIFGEIGSLVYPSSGSSFNILNVGWASVYPDSILTGTVSGTYKYQYGEYVTLHYSVNIYQYDVAGNLLAVRAGYGTSNAGVIPTPSGGYVNLEQAFASGFTQTLTSSTRYVYIQCIVDYYSGSGYSGLITQFSVNLVALSR